MAKIMVYVPAKGIKVPVTITKSNGVAKIIYNKSSKSVSIQRVKNKEDQVERGVKIVDRFLKGVQMQGKIDVLENIYPEKIVKKVTWRW